MKKIWSHPVWSNVIATGIVTVLGFIFLFVYGLYTAKNFNDVFYGIVSYQLPAFWVILIVVVIIVLIYSIAHYLKNIKSSDEKYYDEKIKAFTGNNYRYLFNDINVLCRYSVFINDDTGKPFIYDLKLYCKNHDEVPIEMVGTNCNISGCRNSNIYMSIYDAQRLLESDIIHRWEEFDRVHKK